MEKKYLALDLKADEEKGTFQGYGAVFNNVDQGGDIVLPEAFTKSLSARVPVMLYQHDPNKVIGVWTNIETDEKGLKMSGRFVDTAGGNEAYTLVKEGAISGLSIGYRTIDAEYNAQGNRLLKELDLFEVSLVTFPMNVEATIDAVKAAEMSKKEIENILRDAGFSRTAAKSLISGGYDALRPRDVEEKSNDELISLFAKRIELLK